MEAKGMESLKMKTLRWCKRRTNEDRPASYSVCCNSAKQCDWKFAQIRGYL